MNIDIHLVWKREVSIFSHSAFCFCNLESKNFLTPTMEERLGNIYHWGNIL